MLDLVQVSALSEEQARELLERIRWPSGPICSHCGSVENITRFRPHAEREPTKSGGARPGVFKCNECKGQFTVTVGTIFEDSHIPIRTWMMAFAIMCSAKKGVSALQLQRQLGLGSYRTVWFMAMRIREAMKREPLASLLKGTVEADETYVGGKQAEQAAEGVVARRAVLQREKPTQEFQLGPGEVRHVGAILPAGQYGAESDHQHFQ